MTTVTSSALKTKIEDIKRLVSSSPANDTVVSPRSGGCCKQQMEITTCHRHNCSPQPTLQAPIILQKRSNNEVKKTKKIEKVASVNNLMVATRDTAIKKKTVQEFRPIDIPTRDRKPIQYALPMSPQHNKEIQIRIEKDSDDKQCLKKLFKKINKLTDDLKESELRRSKLELQLQGLRGLDNRQREYQQKIRDLETDKHKLNLQIATLRDRLGAEKHRAPHIVEKVVERPIQVIRQVPVEKIVQVKVEVPKMVPGPQRIVEKFVEVPKYIQVQKKVPMEIVKQVIKEVPREIIKTINVPEYVQKVVYVDKPVYVDKVIEKKVEVPIEVPVEVPIYIDRPLVDSSGAEELRSITGKVTKLEMDLSAMAQQNEALRRQNAELLRNIEVLKRYNHDKNREIEQLIADGYEHSNYAISPVRVTNTTTNFHRTFESPSYYSGTLRQRRA